MNPALTAAAEAPSEEAAAAILRAAGWDPDAAEETAAIMFGSSDGDVIVEASSAQGESRD